jgi:origin recognition complex subunit 2
MHVFVYRRLILGRAIPVIASRPGFPRLNFTTAGRPPPATRRNKYKLSCHPCSCCVNYQTVGACTKTTWNCSHCEAPQPECLPKMKRKKQAEDPLAEMQSNESTRKRAHSGDLNLSDAPADEESSGTDADPMRRRSSRRISQAKLNGNALSSIGKQAPIRDDDADANGSVDDNNNGSNDEDASSPLRIGNGHLEITGITQESGTSPLETPQGTKLFSTPMKVNGASETPRLEMHADRSARRKSTRSFIERTLLGNTSDNEEDYGDIAQHIDGSDREVDQAQRETEKEVETIAGPLVTLSKRGRPRGTKTRQRSPTPIKDLPPHELYFSQNRGARSKTSNNNISSLKLLDHEEYFALLRNFENPHAAGLDSLEKVYLSLFNQWLFELSQDFNICVYGLGSKKSLLMKFAEHLYKLQTDHTNQKIVIVNGYVHNLTIREVLNTVAGAISISEKLGSQPSEVLESFMATLDADRSKHVTIIIHAIDGAALRRPTVQTILSRLSSHSQIHMIASADHPSFPILWDSSLRSTFNFLFHECTTYRPYTDSELDVVNEVLELLGRSGRRVGGKEGVSSVLKALPENARSLFRVLIGEQLAALDENLETGFEVAEDGEENEHHGNNPRNSQSGVEYKKLYEKAQQEFICSNEMSFRTLLKE